MGDLMKLNVDNYCRGAGNGTSGGSGDSAAGQAGSAGGYCGSGGVAAVVLAAGFSSRMGDFKPLLPVRGVPAVCGLLAALDSAGVDRVVVVTGFESGRLQPVVEAAGAAAVYNGRFKEGMFTSIRAGIEAVCQLYGKVDGVLLMPVDCPLISSEVIKAVINSASADSNDDSFRVPVFEGKKGHPLYIPHCYLAEICEYEGRGGLKAVTDKYWDKMIRVPVADEGCVMDMDTPEGYQETLDFVESGCARESLNELATGRRIFLVRHGETQQHREKMFIGRYDVELNDEGREQIMQTAEMIASYTPAFSYIYFSPLKRAAESAQIVADRLCLNERQLCEVKELTEINLGSWDGKSVREIREKYPAEYRRRGGNMFLFKTGNKSENFYDVQYRAVKALRHILKKDNAEDIIIVSHSAVIRALENNLKGLRVDDDWQPVSKGSFKIIDFRNSVADFADNKML